MFNDKELLCFKEYAINPSRDLRNHLVDLNDGLARDEAHRWKEICAVPYEDLCQVARIGLIKAVERFQLCQGYAFSSFAIPYINGEIQHFLRDYSWDLGKVPRRSIEAASKVRSIQRKAIASGRLEITEQQAAQSIGISESSWKQISEVTARKIVLDLNDAVSLISETEDDEQLYKIVRSEVARLPRIYRSIILARYFKGLSTIEIAKTYQVEPTLVELWISEGLRRLRSINIYAVI